jgi:hypothetical protein
MGTTLTVTTPQDTYDSLIKVTDNGPLTGSLKKLTDGLGNDSSLSLSTTAASLSGTLAVTGNATFDTNTLFVDAAANTVGIGTASPTNKLDVAGNIGVPTTNFYRYDGDTALIGSATTITLGTASQLGIRAASDILFATNGATEKMRLTADSYMRMAASTGGIQFNGDTAAANALDDYEEGTFTPTIAGSTTAGTATYTAQNGKYTKIGRQVSVSIDIRYTGGTGTGNLQIAGLPFTAALVTASASIGYIEGVSLTALNIAQAFNTPSTTTIEFFQTPVGGGTPTAVPYDAAALIILSLTYFV